MRSKVLPPVADYKVVATVMADGISREVMCSSMLSPLEANILYVLGEYVGRPLPIEDVCHRLRSTRSNFGMGLSLLRGKLHGDWIVDYVRNYGPRLSYIGGPLTLASRTQVEMSPSVLAHWSSTRQISKEVKEKIRQTMYRHEEAKYQRKPRILLIVRVGDSSK